MDEGTAAIYTRDGKVAITSVAALTRRARELGALDLIAGMDRRLEAAGIPAHWRAKVSEALVEGIDGDDG